MVAHALEEYPNECCGILAGNDNQVTHVYRITNSTKSPYRYLMDSQEQLNAMNDAESKNINLLAFYHSHTHSSAYPSPTDVRMALQSGWLDIYYVLVSLENKTVPQIRAFVVEDGGNIHENEVQVR
mgnify:CR=1 FL=1